MEIYPRIAGRVGHLVSLNMRFLRNGQPVDPFAIRQIDLYRSSIRPGNMVGQILFPEPSDPAYPAPASQVTGEIGNFEVPFLVPAHFVPNDIYFDVWHFVGDDPGSNGVDDSQLWISQRGRFWLFDDIWVIDDGLLSKRVGFEPLDKKLRRGEIRNLEVALHLLPKYANQYNQLAPVLPTLNPTVSVWTSNDELINGLVNAPCRIGIRQGHHLGSPFVVQCPIDTRILLRGTYKYAVKIQIGDQVLISEKFFFTVQ